MLSEFEINENKGLKSKLLPVSYQPVLKVWILDLLLKSTSSLVDFFQVEKDNLFATIYDIYKMYSYFWTATYSFFSCFICVCVWEREGGKREGEVKIFFGLRSTCAVSLSWKTIQMNPEGNSKKSNNLFFKKINETASKNKTNGDHPNYSIIKIGQNTKGSPGDLRRLLSLKYQRKTIS